MQWVHIPDRTLLFEGAVYGGLVHMNSGGGSADIFGSRLWRRVIDQAFAVKRQQQLSTGHVFERAAGLNPVPMFLQFSENMGPAPIPVLIDYCLNDGQVFGGYIAVSDN